MANNLVIESPDFDQIRDETGHGTEDAIRLLWYTLNQEIADRRNQKFTWLQAPYTDTTFSASAGTWTVSSGDYSNYSYAKFGDFLFIQFLFATTSTSAGMGSQLFFTFPSGMKAVDLTATGFGYATGAIDAPVIVGVRASPNNHYVNLQRGAAAAWPSSETNTLSIQGTLIVQIQRA